MGPTGFLIFYSRLRSGRKDGDHIAAMATLNRFAHGLQSMYCGICSRDEGYKVSIVTLVGLLYNI